MEVIPISHATIEHLKNGRHEDNAAAKTACDTENGDDSHALQPGVVREYDRSKACDGCQGCQYNRPAGLEPSSQGTVKVRMSEGVGKVDTIIDADTDDHWYHHDVQKIEVHPKQGHQSHEY